MQYLAIEGDPSFWALQDPQPEDPGWLHGSDPVALNVVGPLFGTLVLSPGHAGSVAFVTQPPTGGWVPCLTLAVSHLYVPSAAGPTTAFPGYVLGDAANLQALEQQIMAAMSAPGSALPVSISIPGKGLGTAVLHGAALAFAVVCPPHVGQS